MAPTIHCIRHAQGFHNLSNKNHTLPDPKLTDLGKTQCSDLSKQYPYKNTTLIAVSPLKRTIYTALYVLSDLIHAGSARLILLPEISETSDLPCDTGSSVSELKKEFAEWEEYIDYSLLYEGWNIKTGKFAPTARRISARAEEARRWLRERPEAEIAVVTHGGLLHYFTQDWEGSTMGLGTGWKNCELRSYRFLTSPADTDPPILTPETIASAAPILETTESRERRGIRTPVPKRSEQERLYQEALLKWESLGLQNPGTMKEHADEKVPAGTVTNGTGPN